MVCSLFSPGVLKRVPKAGGLPKDLLSRMQGAPERFGGTGWVERLFDEGVC